MDNETLYMIQKLESEIGTLKNLVTNNSSRLNIIEQDMSDTKNQIASITADIDIFKDGGNI